MPNGTEILSRDAESIYCRRTEGDVMDTWACEVQDRHGKESAQAPNIDVAGRVIDDKGNGFKSGISSFRIELDDDTTCGVDHTGEGHIKCSRDSQFRGW